MVIQYSHYYGMYIISLAPQYSHNNLIIMMQGQAVPGRTLEDQH